VFTATNTLPLTVIEHIFVTKLEHVSELILKGSSFA